MMLFVVVCCLLEWWVCYRGLYTRGEPEQSPWDGEGQGGTAGPMPLLCRHWPRARPRRRGGALSRVKKRGPRGLWAREVLVAGGFVVLSSLAKKEANACKEAGFRGHLESKASSRERERDKGERDRTKGERGCERQTERTMG